MSNSSLVDYVKISPNRTSPRNHKIDTITIHCFVGQVTVERMGEAFTPVSKQASCNYGIGLDGKIGMYVEEKDRSWCSSSRSNDNRAITIEVACEPKHPYEVTDAAYRSLINLLVDICKRNDIKELKWKADKSLIGKVNKQNMTVHRWFKNKSCPGKYLYDRHGKIAAEVNARLDDINEVYDTAVPSFNKVTASESADKRDTNLSGTYVITANLHLRDDAGVSNKSLCVIPKGTKVKCYGYYSLSKGVKWLYVTFKLDGIKYTGFSSSAYLKK